jgi:hypothetical protein
MEIRTKSEWFRLEKPIGEPEIRWGNEPYDIERFVTSDGTIIWFGQSTNWKKEQNGEWTKLTTNEDAKPLDKYLPEIIYDEDRNYFAPCEIPIYEKLYLELELRTY